MYNRSTLFLAFCLWAVAANGLANDESILNGTVSATAKFATDYVFRGESETVDGEIPAIQTSMTWTHKSNAYVGLFGSTNKFESAPDVYAVIGPYIGKSGSWNVASSEINYNFFVFHYMYPGSRDLDYTELWLNAGRKFDDLNLNLEVTPTLNDWFGVEGWKGINYALHPSYALTEQHQVSGSLGKQELDGNGAEGWLHWNLGYIYTLGAITLDVRYHNTDIDSSHQVYGSEAGQKIFKERYVFSISKSL